MPKRIPDKLISILTDTIWSISGLVLMNVAAQFVVYPYWNRVLGREAYGDIVYQLGIMNILAISLGTGVNYARMRQSAEGETTNRPYNLIMSVGSLVSVLILLLLKSVGLLKIETPVFLFFCALTVLTAWRYYADVEYRLHINYKGYSFYYLIIGIGYLVGILLFKATGLWPMALLPGELAGLLQVFWRGTIFRKGRNAEPESLTPVINLALLLVGTNVLSHLIFNGDRLILRLFVGSTAVTVFYIASLFGKTMTLITTPLNGVLIGHLAKYEGKLTTKLMNQVLRASLTAIIVATIACVVASRIILPLLYPADFQDVKQYLILANAAQVIYFIGNVLTASILLRFTHARNQLIVNVVHGVLFVLVCVPVAWNYGIGGFCWGLLSVNIFRVILCVLLGYLGIKEPAQ